jgi:hypothetical protein
MTRSDILMIVGQIQPIISFVTGHRLFDNHPAMKTRKTAMLIACTVMLAPLILAQPQKPEAVRNQQPVAFDMPALIKETQQLDQRNHKMAIYWWVPVEFFEHAIIISSDTSPERARTMYAPLRDYTIFIIAYGEFQFADIQWSTEEVVRKAVVLRDQAGNIYKPLEKVSREVQEYADSMKPALTGALGEMGKGMHIFFFPHKDSNGREIANPFKRGEFSLITTGLMDPEATTYTWKLPINSLAPPRFCPVGKERIDARWKYCPWHGNKLEDEPEPITPEAPPPKPQPTKPAK